MHLDRDDVENPLVVLFFLFANIALWVVGIIVGLGIGWLFVIAPFDFLIWIDKNIENSGDYFWPIIFIWFVVGPIIMAWLFRQIQLARKG